MELKEAMQKERNEMIAQLNQDKLDAMGVNASKELETERAKMHLQFEVQTLNAKNEDLVRKIAQLERELEYQKDQSKDESQLSREMALIK